MTPYSTPSPGRRASRLLGLAGATCGLLLGLAQAQPQPQPTVQIMPIRGMVGTVQADEVVDIQNPERLLIWLRDELSAAPPDSCQIVAQAPSMVLGWDSLGVLMEYTPPTAVEVAPGVCPRGVLFFRTYAQFQAMKPVFGPTEAANEAQRSRVKRLLR